MITGSPIAAPAPGGPTSRRRRRLLLALSALVLGLVLGEAFLHLLGMGAQPCYEIPRTGLITHQPLHFRLTPGYRGTQICPRSGWRFPRREVPLAINSDGFRDLERAVDREPGSLRVLILGDSVSMAHGVRREDGFAALLERELASAQPGRRFEVINTGIWAMSTEMEAHLYESFARKYRPDVVLVVHVMNDAELTPGEECELAALAEERAPATGAPAPAAEQPSPAVCGPLDGGSTAAETWSQWLISGTIHRAARWTRSGKLVLDVWRRWVLQRRRGNVIQHKDMLVADYGRLYQDGAPGWGSIRRGLQRIAATARDDGAWAAVVLFPMLVDLTSDHPYLEVHRRVAEAASAEGLAVLDLLPAFAGMEGIDLWITAHDDHPAEVAHAVAAREMAAWVLRNWPTMGQSSAPPPAEGSV